MPEHEPPCRCLLTGHQPDLARLVAEYVDSLPEEQKAPETVRQARLVRCLQCENLADGTCRLCGCYVEARAARRNQRCPALPPLWTACGPENHAFN
ncbi:MAG: hypothetical protein IKP40_07330 [Clostridia bacterium]|nr:hypothetical protein [Clostridia bacterium]